MKIRVGEIRVKRIRVNQGLGVHIPLNTYVIYKRPPKEVLQLVSCPKW